MGGGGTETTTQTSGSTNPMVDKTVTNLLTGLNKQVDKGTAVFGQSLYPGLSSTTKGGVNSVVDAAQAGQSGLDAAMDWNAGLLNSGGLTSGQKSAMSGMGGIGNTYGNIASSLSGPSAAQTGFTDLYNGAGGASLTEQQLMDVATGQRFGEDAPGYATLRQNALDDALGGVGSSFLTNGRFGSSIMGDAAGKAATGVLAGMDYQNYQNDIARQERALSAIEGQRQQGFQNQFSALGASDSARLNQLGAQMGALGAQGSALQSQFGMDQQGTVNAASAAAAAPGLFQSTLLPGQAQIAAGQVLDADALAKRQAENDLFRRQNDAGWATLGNASSILAGTAGSGTQQQSVTTPTTPWWQSALGLGISAAGAFL